MFESRSGLNKYLTNSTFINLKNARLVLNAKCEIPSRFTSVIVLR